MKTVRIHEHGGIDVLRYEEVPAPEPTPGSVRVKIEAAGLNFIDTYHRKGMYKIELPYTLGQEAAGVVDALGDGVSEFKSGDRVAYAGVAGAYAEYAIVPAARLVPVPAGTSAEQAAAAILQGMTAHFLALDTFPLEPGHTALIYAAAGGLGLLLVQVAKKLGARVIGTTSTEAKAQLARQAGADEMILYTQQDFEAEVKRLTNGKGVDVVYDSVGKDTFDKGLNCLHPRGYMVLCGQSSGSVPPLDPQILNAKGSLFLTRPSMWHYIPTREDLLKRAGDVFGWIASGELNVRIDRKFPLEEAGLAHKALEGRATTGKVLLIP